MLSITSPPPPYPFLNIGGLQELRSFPQNHPSYYLLQPLTTPDHYGHPPPLSFLPPAKENTSLFNSLESINHVFHTLNMHCHATPLQQHPHISCKKSLMV